MSDNRYYVNYDRQTRRLGCEPINPSAAAARSAPSLDGSCRRGPEQTLERFAVHKLLVSRLRVGRDSKFTKDVLQACVLAAVVAEHHPGALESTVADVPRKAHKLFREALPAARTHLEHRHPRAWEELSA